MRVRPQYVLAGLAVLIGALLLYAVTIRPPGPRRPHSGGEAGLAPPMGEPMERAPAIALETQALNMGTIPRDRNMEHPVRVYNRGGSALEITDIRTTCPCTLGIMDPAARRIAPGESSDLLVRVLPSHIFGFHSVKTVTIVSNDPRNPLIELTVEASVDPEFALEPESFDFGTLEKGASPTVSLRLRQLADLPFELERVALSLEVDEQEEYPLFTFEWHVVPEAEWRQPGRKEYQITAMLAPHCPGGAFERPIFLFTNLERIPHYRVLAKGMVNSFYTIAVQTPGGHPVVNQDGPLQILVKADRPIEISTVETGHPLLRVTALQESPHQWALSGALAPDLPSGPNKTTLSFMVESEGRQYPERMSVWLFPRVP